MKVYYIKCSEGEWEDHISYIVSNKGYLNKEDAIERLKECEELSNIEEMEKNLPMDRYEFIKDREDFEYHCFKNDIGDDWNNDVWFEEFSKFVGISVETLKKMENLIDNIERVEYDRPQYQICEIEVE